MTLLDVTNFYIGANVLLMLAAAALVAIGAISSRLRHPVSYRHQLILGRLLMFAAVTLPLLNSLHDQSDFLPQTAQIWSAPSMQVLSPAAPTQHTAISLATGSSPLPITAASWAALTLLLGGFILMLARLASDARLTARIVTNASMVRRHGRLRILASDAIAVPFSCWVPGRYFIVIPSTLASHPNSLATAIRHEGQHHRHLDTQLVHVQQLLKALFLLNPATHVLARRLLELQEFACDAAVNGRIDADADEYCHCLLQVAETAKRHRSALVRVSMLDSSSSILKRRVEAILQRPTQHARPSLVALAGLIATTAMTVTAYAFTPTIHDRRISLEQAEQMAAVARADSAIPIEINERVLTQLNQLLATPDGRASVQASLTRMREYESFLTQQLHDRNLPRELLAVPLVESGYRNRAPDGNSRHGAGLWMFIAPTARNFGLIVNETKDDRLDVAAETRAALTLFTDLYAQFGSWHLALLSYNAGHAKVEQGLRDTHSRDAWQLISQGYENDPDYLPRVMATILILKNPTIVDRL